MISISTTPNSHPYPRPSSAPSHSFDGFLVGVQSTDMHLILTGATGLVGSAVLHHMIKTPSVTEVSILSRRPVPQAEGHGKVQVIIHKDFNTYPGEVIERLRGAEGCVWHKGLAA